METNTLNTIKRGETLYYVGFINRVLHIYKGNDYTEHVGDCPGCKHG